MLFCQRILSQFSFLERQQWMITVYRKELSFNSHINIRGQHWMLPCSHRYIVKSNLKTIKKQNNTSVKDPWSLGTAPVYPCVSLTDFSVKDCGFGLISTKSEHQQFLPRWTWAKVKTTHADHYNCFTPPFKLRKLIKRKRLLPHMPKHFDWSLLSQILLKRNYSKANVTFCERQLYRDKTQREEIKKVLRNNKVKKRRKL